MKSLDYWTGYYKGIQVSIEMIEGRIEDCENNKDVPSTTFQTPMSAKMKVYKQMLSKMQHHRMEAEAEIDKLVTGTR